MTDSRQSDIEDAGSIGFSSTQNTDHESRKSSIAKEGAAQEEINGLCVIEQTLAWKTFKHILFLICLIFVVIQSVDFYNIYSKYPTNIVQETIVNNDFKLPAVTICFKNTISATNFCRENPNLCEKPKDLEEFCKDHNIHCGRDNWNLTIPKLGYYTQFSSEARRVVKNGLFNESLNDPNLFKIYRRGVNESSMTKTFVDNGLEFFKCYSDNLHLYQSGLKLKTKDIEPFSFYDDTILEYAVSLREILLFETIDKPQVFLGIHSPFIPINPVTDGHALIGGYNYQFEVQLEKEEHLLPPPYQTSCKDNGPSEDAKSFTNPNSFQVCVEMCRSEYSKEVFGCNEISTMLFSISNVCENARKPQISPERERELKNRRLMCTQNCKPECLKLHYKYKMSKLDTKGTWIRGNSVTAHVSIIVKNTEVTVINHVPMYSSGELFSHIGGLLGCWLGISVFTLTDIIEKFLRKAAYWKTRFRMEKLQKASTSEIHLD